MSSRRRGRDRFFVATLVAEHGPEHVDPAAGEGEDGLTVPFALGSFALVVAAGGGTALDADERGGVEHALQLTVVPARAVQVADPVAGVARSRGQTGVAGEVIGRGKGLQIAAGRGEELRAEQLADTDHAGQDGGVGVGMEPAGDTSVEVGELGVEFEHRGAAHAQLRLDPSARDRAPSQRARRGPARPTRPAWGRPRSRPRYLSVTFSRGTAAR